MSAPSIEHEDRQVVTVPRWMMRQCDGDPRDAMVLAQIAFWYQPPLDGSREHRTRHVIHRFDQDWIVMIDLELAEQLGMGRSQVQRARTALAKRGLIETRTSKVGGERRTLVRPVIAGKRESAHRPAEQTDAEVGLCAKARNGSKRESAHTHARATLPVEDQQEDQESFAADAAQEGELFAPSRRSRSATEQLKEQARSIAQTVWDRKNPKPAGKGAFLGLVSVAHALLVAEHQESAVVAGMLAASPVTIRSVEFTIGQRTGSQVQFVPDVGIITDRSGPSGRLQL